MTIYSVSNFSRTTALTTSLQSEQTTLTQLSEELSSGKQHNDLTDYDASSARNLINLQDMATQKQAYLSVIGTAGNNLSIYDTTLTDLESVVTQAQSLANDNQSYSPAVAANVAIQATDYLKSATVDLNQDINGRYLYAGSRYNTPPVQELSTLPASTISSTIQTDSTTVPTYDSASSLSLSTSGQNVSITGTPNGIAGSQKASFDVDGTTYQLTVDSADSTPVDVANDLCNQLATNYGIAVSVDASDPNHPYLAFDPSVTVSSAQVATTDKAAYAADSAMVDTGYIVDYGITSNDPSFQTMVAGLRYLQAAGNATDAATYKTDITQASMLLSSALSAIQNLHTSVANNMNVMTSEKTAQNTAISSLTAQVDNIQAVDVTQVSTEITSLEAILQASYSATGSILKLSIVSYL